MHIQDDVVRLMAGIVVVGPCASLSAMPQKSHLQQPGFLRYATLYEKFFLCSFKNQGLHAASQRLRSSFFNFPFLPLGRNGKEEVE